MKIQDSILAELDVHDHRTEQQLFDWCKCSSQKFYSSLEQLEKDGKIFKKDGKWYHWKRK